MTSSRILTGVLVAVVTGACAKAPEATPGGRAIGRLEHLGPQEFKAAADQKNGLYLDVRTPGEVAHGQLPGATVIDINDPRFDQKVALLPKDRPIFVYCASGNRSSAAGELMVRMGFPEVYELVGGIGGWARAGYPLELPANPPPAPPGLSPAELDAIFKSDARVLVDYQTPWCAPCKKMSPVVDALGEAWKGKVRVVRVDVEQSEALAAREKVQSVPTFVLYVDGKERWRKSGELAREVIEAELRAP